MTDSGSVLAKHYALVAFVLLAGLRLSANTLFAEDRSLNAESLPTVVLSAAKDPLINVGCFAGLSMTGAGNSSPQASAPTCAQETVEPPPGEKQAIRGITYATVGALELKLDLHLPVAKPERPLPVLLWLHAGGWREGGRGFCPIANLAKEGYAVASISYRFSQQAKFPAQIEDCKAAVRWLRAHAAEYSLDPARIGACGESAGGHLAALLGVTGGMPELEGAVGGNEKFSGGVQAVVALCPPVDFRDMLGAARERSFWAALVTSGSFSKAGHTFARNHALKQLFGGPVTEHAAQVRLASPVTHVNAGDAPVLLFHGRGDPLIPLTQSEEFLRVLTAAGVEARLEIIETNTHGFGRFPPDMMSATRTFFNRHLKSSTPVALSDGGKSE